MIVIKQKQKNNWQTVDFESCIEKVVYPKKVLKKDFLESGSFPIISQELEFINGYWNNQKNLFKVEKPVVIFGDHTKILKFVDFDFVFGADGVKILQPKDFLYPKYFYYFLQNLDLKSLGYARHYRLLKEKTVSYPPLTEQKRIVKILDEAFEKIEKAKENTEKNLKNSKEIFESYLQSVFENKGDDSKYSFTFSKKQPNTKEENSEWEEKRLGEVCEIQSKLVDPRKLEFLDLIHVGAGNIKIKSGELINLKTSREEKLISGKFRFNDSMVLYSKIRPYLMKVARPNFQGLCSADIYPLSPHKNLIIKDFLFYLLLTSMFTDFAIKGSGRAGMPKVNRNHLFSFTFFLPPLKTQKQIVAKLDKLSAHTQKMENHYKFILNSLEELKKSLLKKAFEGEL